MEQEKTGFLFLPSYLRAIETLPNMERLNVYDAICHYGIDRQLPEELSGVTKAMMTLIRPNIDASINRYASRVENGKKGGRPRKKPNENKSENKDKDKDKDMDKDIRDRSPVHGPDWQAIDRENDRSYEAFLKTQEVAQ